MSKSLAVDAEAFKKELKDRGLTQAQVSEGIGFHKTTLTKYLKKGSLPIFALESIENMYDVPKSSYVIGEVEREHKVAEGSINMIEVDGMKLRNILCERKLSASYVSREMGYNDNMISHICNANKVSKPAMKMLELRFNITYDDIKPDEPEPEPEEEKEVPTIGEVVEGMDKNQRLVCDYLVETASKQRGIDYDKLYEVIFSAAYKGMKQALTEGVNELSIIKQDKLEEKRKERRTYRTLHPEMFGDAPKQEFDIKEGFV